MGGYWPQWSGQSQSVNHSYSLTNIHFKSGGWPGFEHGSLTFMASALTSKLPTKLIKMSACLLTDDSRTFYQGLHFTCRYNTQLKFQQLICTWGGIGHYVPQRSGQRQSVNHSNSLTNIHFKSGGWLGLEPGSLTFMASALTSKLPTKLIEMSACLLTDDSRTFYQGLHFTFR